MKKVMIVVIITLLVASFVGCAQQNIAQAATPEPTKAAVAATPAETPAPEQTAAPAPTEAPTPQPEPVFEVVLKDAPADFEIDERYEPFKFTDKNLGIKVTEDTPELIPPTFAVYTFEDADGNVQYRAYGEKYETITREDGKKFVAIEPEPNTAGLYAVEISVDENRVVVITAIGDTPVTVEQDFPQVEKTEKPDAKKDSKSTKTATTNKTESSSGGSSNNTPTNNSGGGNDTPAPTPAPNNGGGGDAPKQETETSVNTPTGESNMTDQEMEDMLNKGAEIFE